MPKALKIVRLDDFTGGLNLRADPFQLARNESPDLLNVDVDPRGGFAQRSAWRRLNSSAIGSVANGSFDPKIVFAWTTSTNQLLLAANSKVFFSADGVTWTDASISTQSSGASFAPWSTSSTSVVYVARRSGTIAGSKWDGTTATALSANGLSGWQDDYASPTGTHMPRADYVASHNDRLWVASTVESGVTYPNRVRFSHPHQPESWRQDDYIDIPSGGSGITALVPFGDALLIFKRDSVHAIYGYDTDNFQLVTLTTQVGAYSDRCVAVTEGALYLLHWPRGVFAWDGNKFSEATVRLRALFSDPKINAAALGRASLSWCKDHLWLSVPTGTSTIANQCYVFDPTIGAWTRYQSGDGLAVGTLTDFVVTSSGQRIYVGLHVSSAFALNIDDRSQFDDNISGTELPFPSYYTTGWVDDGIVSSKKMWRQPDFVVKQADTEVTLTIDVFRNWEESIPARTYDLVISTAGTSLVYASDSTEPDAIPGWGEADYGVPAAGAQHERGQRLGLARSVSLKISGPGSLGWGVNSITLKYNPRRIR